MGRPGVADRILVGPGLRTCIEFFGLVTRADSWIFHKYGISIQGLRRGTGLGMGPPLGKAGVVDRILGRGSGSRRGPKSRTWAREKFSLGRLSISSSKPLRVMATIEPKNIQVVKISHLALSPL